MAIKINAVHLIITATLCSTPVLAETLEDTAAKSLTGAWTSEFGDTMLIDTDLPAFKARVNFKQGRITGDLHGNALEGFWIQGNESSRGRCKEKRDGSTDWGRIQLDFTGDSYKGKWGYCDGNLSYRLAGKRKSTSQSTAQTKKPVPIYRIGDGFQPHDMSHLPVGNWKPWYVSIYDNSYSQKELGLKAQDIKRFEKKLTEIVSTIKESAVLNPARGCAPSMTATIMGAYDKDDPYSKKQPLYGDIMFGCFKLYEEKVKKSGKVTLEWVPDHETRHYIVYVNSLKEILEGHASWYEGPSSIRPLDMYFEKPEQVGEFQGFPIYALVTPYGELLRHKILIARKGVQPFLSVTRERLANAMVKKVDREIERTRDAGRQPANDDLKRREDALKHLASLEPEEKGQPACYLHKQYDPGWGTPESETTEPLGTQGCVTVVQINPELIDLKVSSSAIQFLIISKFDDVQDSYNKLKPDKRDNLSHFRVEMGSIIQADWNKVLNLFDKP